MYKQVPPICFVEGGTVGGMRARLPQAPASSEETGERGGRVQGEPHLDGNPVSDSGGRVGGR